MPHVAFQLRLRPGTIEEYEKAHLHVGPDKTQRRAPANESTPILR
jgi:L-rhamnose mutarotase